MTQPSWKTVWRGPQKFKTELSYDLAIPLFAYICQEEFKAGPQRDICTPMFIAALFAIAKM